MENGIKCLRKNRHFVVMKTFEPEAFGHQRKEVAFLLVKEQIGQLLKPMSDNLVILVYSGFSSKQFPESILTCLCLVMEY